MSLDELIEHFKDESVWHCDKETRDIAYDTVEYLKELRNLRERYDDLIKNIEGIIDINRAIHR